jgi:glycosyltransferase involved in cell wall biosynthesis
VVSAATVVTTRLLAPGATLPVSVVLPVLNEELNLSAALESVAWADEVVVVDSGSTDRTVQVAHAAGAELVRFDYPGHGPKKKAWALTRLDLRNDWVLLLDADERVTDALRTEIGAAIEGEADGYYVDRELVFMGRSMRCFRPNWNLRLFRRGRGHVEDLGLHEVPETGDNEIHEHTTVEGEVGYLSSPLLHNDYRGLTAWLDRHNKYATWEAHLYRKLRMEPIGVGPVEFLRLGPFERKRVLRRLWVRFPFRASIRFLVWYVLRRGFLDGRVGFVFCVLMSYYEFIIGAKLRELERVERAAS